MTTLHEVELGVLGPLQVRQYGLPVSIPGAKPRTILAMLGLHGGSVVSADTLVELLWGDDPPRTAAKALQTHISSLRRALGDGFVLTQGTGWTLSTTEIDATRYKSAAKLGRAAFAAGDVNQAVARFDEALSLWRGIPELPESQRGVSEKTRWIEGHAAMVEDRAEALLATGRAAEIIGDLEAGIADAPLRERRWGQLMLALYRAGRQGEALAAYQRARSLLADQLGVDPGPDLRRLEAAIVAQDDTLEISVLQQLSTVTKAVTFLLTDIEGSTAAWEADAPAMAVALARHDEVVEQVVTSRGGRLIKTRGEGDATFSVFDRPSGAAAAAIELQEAIRHEPWALAEPMRIRVALHTGEVELRDGDYFGRAVNRAARLRSLATGGQILCSGATAELVIDTLSDDVLLVDLGTRQLKNLARPEHVFELRLETTEDAATSTPDVPMERPDLPAVLAGPGPFVGRGAELEGLLVAWQTTLDTGTRAVLIAGEPGVGKTRLAGEWSRQAYEQGAVVLYGRCDEDLGAPYQPFAEALRALAPCLGANRLRGLRGVEALLALVPGLTDVLPDLTAPPRADADTERYALFDAVVAVLGIASASAPVVLVLDDLHWAAKPTLLLLRHLLRFGEHARVQIVGTYRSTDLDRSHPLAAMLADLHRDGSANRLQLNGLDEDDVTAYVAEAGYDDEELARALASVTGGNPFFLIEALRHVDESGGHWDPSTLPQGVREAVSRRLSRLPAETNKALAAAAVVGSRFAIELVERVVGEELVDAFDEASKAGIVIEEPGGRYRFNHAIVRQSLLAELASVRRMRLHQRIAASLETEQGADDELLAELAYHYFECAWAGNAAKAVDYCRRAADQAMARLAYEGAADLYDKALHALDELDDELPDRADLQAELLVARCEALLAAGDVGSAGGAVSQLQGAAHDSARLAAWGTCFDGQLSMLTDPERLDEIETALGAAAEELAGLDDAAGEAKAHTVRAECLARLGRIGDCETALDQALTAARRAGEHRRVNAVLAGAPLAALWGPNPVPRAGGRCLDVVRLLRITTGSPVVEATSTRCQGVLDAFRGRAAAGRQLIDSARRSLTELGMRHALLEVEQFAGIVEMVADDPASAEPHLRRAYNGFRRMGLEADTAETAALLARACLALGRDAEADELCTESERLAGHALKPSIAWRTVRAQLLARGGAHDEARRVAKEAVTWAERTDLLVDHGDACLAMATVLRIAGDEAGTRAAAEKAVSLYELKGAAALAEKARKLLGAERPSAPAPPEPATVELNNACTRVIDRLIAALNREAWSEVEQLSAVDFHVESRRKVIAFTQDDLFSGKWTEDLRRLSRERGDIYYRHGVVAVRGERLALIRLELGTADESSGAPQSEMLQVAGLDQSGHMALSVWFDIEDMDAAMAELDAAHARLEERPSRAPLENAATRLDDRAYALYAENRLDELGALLVENYLTEDRRQGLRRVSNDRATALQNVRAIASLGGCITNTPLALRGERLCLSHILIEQRKTAADAFSAETLDVVEVDRNGMMVARIVFDPNDIDAAIEELDARYLAGEAAPHAQTWSEVAQAYAKLNQQELPATTPNWINIDHRRLAAVEAGHLAAYVRDAQNQWGVIFIEAVHRLSDVGAVVSRAIDATSQDGFDAEWREIDLLTFEGTRINRLEIFDEADIEAALASFDVLSQPVPRLENAASRVAERLSESFAARDWVGMGDLLADDFHGDDHRQLVNVDLHGRDAVIESFRAVAEFGIPDATSVVHAIRGEHLVLTRVRYSLSDEEPDAFHVELLQIVEIDPDERITSLVTFDLNDVDAAFEELDARYLAGEGASYARVWQGAIDVLGEANRHERGPILSGLTYVDHRRVSFGSDNFGRAVEELWPLVPDARYRVTAVHALDAHATVASLLIEGTDSNGNELQWSRIVAFVPDEPRMEVYEDHDVEAALARFDELSRPARRLENAASQAVQRFEAHFVARDSGAIADMFADDYSFDDRRRIVNSGVRHGRDGAIEDVRVAVEVGLFVNLTSSVIATRGRRLVLTRFRASGHDPEAIQSEALNVIEIDADDRITGLVMFDPGNIDAAFDELDARYLAGEAAPYSRTWSVIGRNVTAFNRGDRSTTTPDWVTIDHRRVARFAPGELAAAIQDSADPTPEFRARNVAVHRLNDCGAVVTTSSHGTSPQGFEAEWTVIQILTIEGELISRCELFDETDLDAALARFDELTRPVRRLENTASQVYQRLWTYFAARDWAALAEIVADEILDEDRRRVVNAGARHGRDALIANLRAIDEVGAESVTSSVVATRGERLALSRVRFTMRRGEISAEVLNIAEIDANGRFAASVQFDPDDIDAAFEELDARYLAGEAATYAHTWSLIAEVYATFNRHELPTADWVAVDHRRVTPFASGNQTASIRATLDLMPDFAIHIEAVRRLSSAGAVVTHTARGTSPDGFDAEWRHIQLLTVEGDRISRSDLFDEADLDAALARFDELNRPARRLENAASQAYEHVKACFAARDWDAIAEMLADDICSEDRRRVVNAGLRYGRDALVAELSAIAEVGVAELTSDVIATRGGRLVLSRVRVSESDPRPEAFSADAIDIIEVNADRRVVARVVFDFADLDAAFEELDARYLAGEAADHARTWSVITAAYAALNRHELSPTTADWVNIDHRHGAPFAPGDLIAYLRASWDQIPDMSFRIEAVHRLSNLGAVFTQVMKGTSHEGFDAEWRLVEIMTVEGDLVSRAEIFDEADIDAALAKFDELNRPAPRLENAASQAAERFCAYFAARDWTAIANMTDQNMFADDRRRVVGAGVRHGRQADIENFRAWADLGVTNITSDVIATRGGGLALSHARWSGPEQRPEAVHAEALAVIETDTDNQIAARVMLDPNDLEAAFEELDARYLAGEANPHAHTWSVIAEAYAALNRRELPATTPDWVNIDHRRAIAFAPGELFQWLRASWELTPDINIRITAVHRLSSLGAVVTHTANATSHEGFVAEWRVIVVLTVDGELINHDELFDEADLETALARFDELTRSAPRLENAASQVNDRFDACFAARDWNAMAAMVAEDMCNDDRRRVVGAGIRRGRDAEIANMRAIVDLGVKNAKSVVVATRGQRLALLRTRFSGHDPGPGAFHTEIVDIVEINADNRITRRIAFDAIDFDAAFEELDARYLAGEAAAHVRTWSVIAGGFAAVNKRELPDLASDWVNVDHRRERSFAPGISGDMAANISALWDQAPDVRVYIEAVHGLTDLGAVFTQGAHGTSQRGFEAEWRAINLETVDGDLISRCELFDEVDLDAALAKFDELSRPASRLENAATRVNARLIAGYVARDWAAMANLLADDLHSEDHRRVVNADLHGRDTVIESLRYVAELGIPGATSITIATRGERLALTRIRYAINNEALDGFHVDLLQIIAIDDHERIAAFVTFDPDDIDAAIEELDARYVAGEAEAYAHTWSVTAAAFAALNRHEVPATTPDYVLVDHQLHHKTIEASGLVDNLRASWDLTPDLRMYIEEVHRLTGLGVVVTLAVHGISTEGFDADWRIVELLTREGDLGKRCEVFKEEDLDAALARFDELSRPTPRLENAASRLLDRFPALYAAHDWDAIAGILAEDVSSYDRRRVVAAGVRQGREAEIANMRAMAGLGITNITWTVIATRGERLVLTRARYSGRDQTPDAYLAEVLAVYEVDVDDRIAAFVVFDSDALDAAFTELDTRYAAGESAEHSRTWSVLTQAYAVLNRRGLPPTTPDWVNVDHRRGASFAPGDMTAYISVAWTDLEQDLRIYIEAVHRLSDRGAVLTQVLEGTTHEGFDAEWRTINLYTVDGDLFNRCELFDEADLDAALARFDELNRPAPWLENAASQVYERIKAYFAARDWDAIREILADDIRTEDRRRVANAGVRQGRDAVIAEVSSIAAIGATKLTSEVIATRGEHLVLSGGRASEEDQGPESFRTDLIDIVEIDADERVLARIIFDVDDIDAAFEELDARYLAGEATAHAHTWSFVARTYAALNRRELPATTADWVNIDHRRVAAVAPGDLLDLVRAAWDVTPDISYRVAAVHRLSTLGVVVTHTSKGRSQEGFDAEWRVIVLVTLEGDAISHCEMFDETDLDAALARFDELARPAPPLENAASRVVERFNAHFAERNWAAMAEVLAADIFDDDRRRVVSAGTLRGRDDVIADVSALADIGAQNIASEVIATRGARLVLSRARYSGSDQRAEAFHVDALDLVETTADDQIGAHIAFDPDDLEAAFEELNRRYLAGEAAAYAHTWSVVAGAIAAFNQHELPDSTPDFVLVDHRQFAIIEADALNGYTRVAWDQTPDLTIRIESVYLLNGVGSVFAIVAHGTSQVGFDAEWRMIELLTVEGDLVNRIELRDEADVDSALARFDELSCGAQRLQNEASRLDDRFGQFFAARDWDAMAELMADDIAVDDRRRVVNAGLRRRRNAVLAVWRATVDVGSFMVWRADTIATRGARLVLRRAHWSGDDERPEAFHSEALCVVELDRDDRIAAHIMFDLDDVEAAFDELDARYLAGEASPHAHTWSVISKAYAALNRRELAATTPDWVNIDHRSVVAAAPGDLTRNIRAAWDVMGHVTEYIEAVHRLTDLGAVITRMSKGTSREGFDAEWREVDLTTVEGDLINRSEKFDETDLDAALAKFDELSQPTPRLENAASRTYERFWTCVSTRDWVALTELLSADIFTDDRRRVVNGGSRHGRDTEIADKRVLADLGMTNVTVTVVAIRGERLALNRVDSSEFETEVFNVAEIDADNRIAAIVGFDIDDINAAFEELDARYLAGEAAAHSHTWKVMAQAFAATNRREIPEFMPDFVSIDHRRARAFAPGDLPAYIRATWDLAPDVIAYAEAVHRLSNLGAVFTQAVNGTSQDGFEAEWREICVATVEGDRINRIELFDEADLDAALARFDELSRPTPQLENAATRECERLLAYFAAREWDAMAELLADGTSTDDRRNLLGVGHRSGRDAVIADWQTTADVGVKNVTAAVIATRGERLVLGRYRFSGRDQRPDAFHTEVFGVVEIDTDQRIAACVMLDLGDIDTAFAELDARYVAGEAAAHSRTWKVMAQAFAATNRREIPEFMPDFVSIDHRRARAFAPGDLPAYIRATWDLAPDVIAYAEAVHRLSNLGAVFTQAVNGTSQDGFEAEWREICVATVEGDRINRIELFDEADLDAALARFDELNQLAPRLENAATHFYERFRACLNSRDWAAFAELLADEVSTDDRRRVVNAGVRHGRDAVVAEVSALAEIGLQSLVSETIATRGEDLALSRVRSLGDDLQPDAFYAELLDVLEIDADERVVARVVFDLDDIAAAFAELDARYIAGEEAAYAQTWSVIARNYAAFNCHKFPSTTPDWVTLDHRRTTSVESGDLPAYISSLWDDIPDATVYIETVHRVSERGAVITQVTKGTSREGFEAEWREINLVTVAGELITRSELFDEADLDAALARFDELQMQSHRVENAATRVYDRYHSRFAARDWDAIAGMVAEDHISEDRRRVANEGIRHGRDAEVASAKSVADLGATSFTTVVIATRGERLALCRTRGTTSGGFSLEVLRIVEIDADERIVARVAFDLEDIDAAYQELDSRYLTGEAAAHAHTWSVISGALTALNRHELPELTPDCVNIDHRRGIAFAPGDMTPYIGATLDDVPDFSIHLERVHRLNSFGAVVTFTSSGTSRGGFDAEWRMIQVLAVRGDMISRCELFDEEDLDTALEKFEELNRPRLENMASHVYERLQVCFLADEWDAMAHLLADDFLQDDRRRVVGAGARHGRDAQIEDMRAIADLGFKHWTPDVIATRGSRLFLRRVRYSDSERPDAVHIDVLEVVESDADERMTALVIFDPEDIDTAFAELDARYAAGESAVHARTWSLVAQTYTGFNRRELVPTLPNWESVDHRRGIASAQLDVIGYAHAAWDVTPNAKAYVETVHQLSNLGAVVTAATDGTSEEGFDAEWRDIHLITFEGDLGKHFELFDEDDLDAALARFDELNAPAPVLENAATRNWTRLADAFNRRDMDGFLAHMASDGRSEDRRKGLGALYVGPTWHKAVYALFDITLSSWQLEVEPVAVRGSRLSLTLQRCRDNGAPDRPITAEFLTLTEVDDDDRMREAVTFDPDDLDAAFEELDIRYIAGEAPAHAHTWSVLKHANAALNRRELPGTTSDYVLVDHRPLAMIEANNLTAYVGAGWGLTPQARMEIEAVHRLTNRGAVVSWAAHATSQQGFDAEWRQIIVVMIEGDLISSAELFDEDDLDAALARFDELSQAARQIENAATRTWVRLADAFNRRDVDAFVDLTSPDGHFDDRRKGLRDAQDASMRRRVTQGLFDFPRSWRMELEHVAIRGSRLCLSRQFLRDTDDTDRPITLEVLVLTEVNDDNLARELVLFDPDDVDGAFTELESRYLVGEAAAHSQTWSATAGVFAGLNRHELPATTPDWVHIDHRHLATAQAGDLPAYLSAGWEVTPQARTYIEAVHRLNDSGAVFTYLAYGTSREGFDAEWREVCITMFEGDKISRGEVFDEADIDAALARFDQLTPLAPRLENAAARANTPIADAFNRRELNDYLSAFDANAHYDDRRKGLRSDGPVDSEFVRSMFFVAPASLRLETESVAIRDRRLALSRYIFRDFEEADRPITVEVLLVTEVNHDGLVSLSVLFDPDDVNGAFGELTARWIASGQVAHPEVIEASHKVNEAYNRHDWNAVATYEADATYVNHRQLASGDAETIADHWRSMRALESLIPDLWVEGPEILAYSATGVVNSVVVKGTTAEGAAIELPAVILLLFDGPRVIRMEAFDFDQRELALARFEDLN